MIYKCRLDGQTFATAELRQQHMATAHAGIEYPTAEDRQNDRLAAAAAAPERPNK